MFGMADGLEREVEWVEYKGMSGSKTMKTWWKEGWESQLWKEVGRGCKGEGENSKGEKDREVIVCYSVDTIHLHVE